jgi:hypothetical protein
MWVEAILKRLPPDIKNLAKSPSGGRKGAYLLYILLVIFREGPFAAAEQAGPNYPDLGSVAAITKVASSKGG